MTKRILALVLCLTIIVGELVFFPAPVKAGSEPSQITDYYTDPNPDDTTNHKTDIYRKQAGDDPVWVTKQISKTDKENEFDIKLQVETQSEIIPPPPVNSAVVIVLDISYSMNSDLDKMKTAANNFIDKYAETALGGKRYVSVVLYGTDVETDETWYNAATSSGKTTPQSTINAVQESTNTGLAPR